MDSYVTPKEAQEMLNKQAEDFKKKQSEYRKKEFDDSCCSKCGFCFSDDAPNNKTSSDDKEK